MTDTRNLQNLINSHLRFVVEPGEPGAETFNANSFRDGNDSESSTEVDDKPEVKSEVKPAVKPDAEPSTYKPLPVWDKLKSELHSDTNPWDIPEPLKTGKKVDGTAITIDDEYALLSEAFKKKYSTAPEQDDFIKEYQESKAKGITLDNFIKTKNDFIDLSKLSVDDKVRLNLEEYSKTEGLNWTKEDIDAELASLTKVNKDIQAKAFEKSLSAKQQAKQAEDIKKFNDDYDVNYNKANKSITQEISNYVKNLEGKTAVAGIEFGEADMTQFKKDLPEFMNRKLVVGPDGKKTSYSPAEEMLAQVLAKPESTYDLLPFLWMLKNDKLKGYSNRVKETIKKNLENSLDDKPEVSGAASGLSGGFNSESFRGGN